jgi:anti-anti-sigma factor
VLRCTGDEDIATAAVRRRALSRALASTSDLVVDLGGLSFADTSLVLDLAILARRLRFAGRRMLLRAPQPQVWRVIDLSGLHRLPGVVLDGPAPVGR